MLTKRIPMVLCAAALGVLAQGQKTLRITEPPDGAILNLHDGKAAAGGLEVAVKGVCRGAGFVKVNGRRVPVRHGEFTAPVVLGRWENKVTAEAGGGMRDTAVLLWDRDSQPRYRFSVDDNIWFLRDIARNAGRYQSIFENPYLAFWRRMHDQYGAKIHFNIYYQTDGFNLSEMPDRYKPEWQRNKDWIRLTFHARADQPDKPYINATGDEIRKDYRLVTREIERFAGRELLSATTTVHWGEATLDGARALRAEGIKLMAGYFQFAKDKPVVSYYLDAPRARYLMGRDYWKDTKEDLIFVRHDIVINSVPLDKIVAYLERVAADTHQAHLMELMIHEQYFYPDYARYEPDYCQRVEKAIEWATKKGYRSTLCVLGEEYCAPPKQ